MNVGSDARAFRRFNKKRGPVTLAGVEITATVRWLLQKKGAGCKKFKRIDELQTKRFSITADLIEKCPVQCTKLCRCEGTPFLRVIGPATDVVGLLIFIGRRLACAAESNRAPSGALRGYLVTVERKAGIIEATAPLECASVISDPCGRSSDIRQQLSQRHDGGPDVFARFFH
ncbi:hypothetical protein EVAR_39413_1 [Eumeta japonica]|uniref:Uncharacterized protein n=1 Tax=Eumeta variegata TaxID=151549 RepID=A0A4C1Z032_EUMVA|nr:hypothetical protein EVAR_39413_1 [Eumeta japonica]